MRRDFAACCDGRSRGKLENVTSASSIAAGGKRSSRNFTNHPNSVYTEFGIILTEEKKMAIRTNPYESTLHTLNSMQTFFEEVVLLNPADISNEKVSKISQEVSKLEKIREQIQNPSNLSPLEIDAISQQIFLLNDLVEKFDTLQEGAMAVQEVFSSGIQPAESSWSEDFPSLSERVTDQTARSPVSAHPRFNPVDIDREIRAVQEREYQVALFRDRLNNIKSQADPERFENSLHLYTEVRHIAAQPAFVTEEASKPLEELRKDIEAFLDDCIQQQEGIERESAAADADNTQRNQALLNLKEGLEKLCKDAKDAPSTSGSFSRDLQSLYLNLHPESKKDLLKALNNLLIQKRLIQRHLAPGLLGLNFATWPTTRLNQLEALNRILPASSTAAPLSSLAEEMRRRLDGAKSAVYQPPARPISPEPVPVRTVRESTSDSSEISEQETQGFQTPILQGIEALQEILPLLKTESYADFQLALEKWMVLESDGQRVSGQGSGRIADRIPHHLYFIHKNEQPSLLVPDGEYGRKALVGEFPATNDERIRAVRRTLLEVALEGLEDAVNFGNDSDLRAILMQLETLEMDPKDALPLGKTRIAKDLFARLSAHHFSKLSTEVPVFDATGDFGRWGFYNAGGSVQPETKIEVIQQLRNDLRQVWKVK